MTSIYIHGQLSDEFPSLMTLALQKASDVTNAIDAIHDGFRRAIINLNKLGIHYAIIADGCDIKNMDEANLAVVPDEIHLVPIICGAGAATAIGLIGGGIGLIAGAGALTTAGGLLAGLGITAGMVTSFGMLVAGIGLQMLLAPKPDMQRPESAVSGLQESSFVSSNSANLMVQGAPLPIGYGRLRVGSAVINVTTKSFQVTEKQKNTMLSNSSGSLNSSTQISTKQGSKSR